MVSYLLSVYARVVLTMRRLGLLASYRVTVHDTEYEVSNETYLVGHCNRVVAERWFWTIDGAKRFVERHVTPGMPCYRVALGGWCVMPLVAFVSRASIACEFVFDTISQHIGGPYQLRQSWRGGLVVVGNDYADLHRHGRI